MFTEWIQMQGSAFWLITVGSLAIFIGTLVAVPIFIRRLPADYLTRKQRPAESFHGTLPTRMILGRIFKNVVGAICIVIGVVMLVLPGQGLLTIVVGLALMDFPGKSTLEKRFLLHPPILRAINWMRRRAGSPMLQVPSSGSNDDESSPSPSEKKYPS